MKPITAILLFMLLAASRLCVAQDDPVLSAKMQFSSVLMGATNNFKALKGAKEGEDENFTYYDSEYGLGTKALTILNNRKDTSEWYCFIRYNLETGDLKEISNVESGVFGLLNMIVGGGKLKGSEKTENDVTRTDLYVTADNAWLGELVTDGNKKTFHILIKNVKWQ